MSVQTLIKQPSESRLYSIDFTPLLSSGETVSSVTSFTSDQPTGAAALSISGIAASASLAQARIAGGTDKYAYKITAVVSTSLGNTLEGEGILQVKDL